MLAQLIMCVPEVQYYIVDSQDVIQEMQVRPNEALEVARQHFKAKGT